MSKIKNVLGLMADLAPGATLVFLGLTVAVGGATGFFWM